ncbi:MAG: hypothetical protein IPL65_17395 [Lewinellaceae bacterium]|nr:hypothetical protein [Lewinellaceae bacterium]
MRWTILILNLFWVGTGWAQVSMPPEMWRSDINLMRDEIPKRYPDFFAHYPKEAWETNLQRVAERVEGKSNLQVGLELQSIVARLGDSWFNVELTQQLQTSKVIPIGLGWFDGGLYVSGTIKLFEKTLGRQVLAVNGVPPGEALEKIKSYISLENGFGLEKDGPQWLRFCMVNRLAGLSPNDTLVLTLATPNQEPEDIKVFPVDFRSMNRLSMMPAQLTPKDPDLRFQPLPMGSMYRVNWLPDNNLLYFQINYCASQEMAEAAGDSLSALQLPPFKPQADSIVAYLTEHPEARLFLDLRYNPGGNPADGIAFARRIGADPDLNQKGRLFIGINNYTAAAPLQIAAAFRQYTKATIVGEPSAEKPVHTGEKDFLKLPNSGLQVFYPKAFLPQAATAKDAFYPDVTVKMTFEAFKNGKDPVMDYVKGL